MMIDRLKRFSISFYWLKPIAVICLIGAFVTFGYSLLCKDCAPLNEQLQIPAGIILLWSGALYWFLAAFPGVPDKPGRDRSLFKRLKTRLHRGVYIVFALVGICLTLAIVFFTSRAVRIWLAG